MFIKTLREQDISLINALIENALHWAEPWGKTLDSILHEPLCKYIKPRGYLSYLCSNCPFADEDDRIGCTDLLTYDQAVRKLYFYCSYNVFVEKNRFYKFGSQCETILRPFIAYGLLNLKVAQYMLAQGKPAYSFIKQWDSAIANLSVLHTKTAFSEVREWILKVLSDIQGQKDI